jgi:hypothetical protein
LVSTRNGVNISLPTATIHAFNLVIWSSGYLVIDWAI